MQTDFAIIGMSWLVFLIVWLIAALGAKRTVRRSGFFFWLRIVVIALVIVALHYQLLDPALLTAYHPTLLSANIGALLTILGVALAIWARAYLGRHWGMPMSQKENAELVTTGPYAFIRHPIYTGMLVALIGSSLALGLFFLFVLIVSGIYFIYSATQEEKRMAMIFASTYPAYKARTKMLIPFIF